MILVSQFVDLTFFFRHLYSWKAAKLTNDKILSIDYHSFVILEHITKQLILEY
jgi:hypothetical protein